VAAAGCTRPVRTVRSCSGEEAAVAGEAVGEPAAAVGQEAVEAVWLPNIASSPRSYSAGSSKNGAGGSSPKPPA
jgi:hypothetical protein